MESKLETLLRVLKRCEPSTTVRKLTQEASALLACCRATDAEIAELLDRAGSLLGGKAVAL